MADDQVSNGTTGISKKKKINKTSSSRNDIAENGNNEVGKQEDLVVLDSVSGADSADDEEEAAIKSSDKRNDPTNNVDDAEDEKEDPATDLSSRYGICKFPMNRISRIIKSAEDPNMRITHEAVFLINKSSEKFLELFSKEAYDCALLDGRKQVEYKHLSTVVSKRKRFDFVSDFVPEKVKAKDALEEMPSAET